MAGSFGDDFFSEAMSRSRGPLHEFMQMATPGYSKGDFGSPGGLFSRGDFSTQGLTSKAAGANDNMPGFGLTSSPAFPNPENEFMGAVSMWQQSQQTARTSQAAAKAAKEAKEKAATPSAGGSSVVVPGQPNAPVAGQIVSMATKQYGNTVGPVVAALLYGENGLTGSVGDSGNSFGPFQFHMQGQLPGYAAARHIADIRGAAEMARTQPLDAAEWALSPQGYLGQALASGVQRGLQGERLLQHVLAVQNPGARPGTPEYSRYQQGLTMATQQAQMAPAGSVAGTPAAGASQMALRILSQADQWIAANPRYQMVPGATNRQTADCSGFIVGLMQELGTPFAPGVRTAEDIRRHSLPVAPGDIKPGDVVFFHSTYDGAPPANQASHVGIVQQNGIMIHTGGIAPLGPANYETPYWRSKFMEVRRLPQVVSSYAEPQ